MKWAALALVSLALVPLRPARAQTALGGFFEYDNITYVKKGDVNSINGRNQGILMSDLRHRFGAAIDAFGSLEFRVDQADPSRSRVYLDEAYLNLYLGDVDVRLGKQIYAWGRADAVNPTDYLTSWDYSDLLDTEDERIGLWSAWAEYYLGDWSFAGALVPSFTPSLLPGLDSRWWPTFPSNVPNPAYPEVGSPTVPVSYAMGDPALPNSGIESVQYVVRAKGSTRGWDFSVSWFNGFNNLPGFDTVVAADSGLTAGDVEFQLTYHRRRALGADFATTLGPFGVRGEAAYYFTGDWNGTDPTVDDPYLQYALGLDYRFRDVVADEGLLLLVEWVQEIKLPDRGQVYGPLDLQHVFRKSLFGRAELNLGAYSKLTLEGVVNGYAGDWWFRPGFDWSVADGVQLIAQADVLGGPVDSFFGTYRDNSRVHVRMRYSF